MSNGFQYLVKVLDRAFSKAVRQATADHAGVVKCYTCPNVFHWTQMDCGHFRRRQHLSTRWHEKNCKPQCKYCNQKLDGNEAVFAANLKLEYGDQIVDELTRMSKKDRKWSCSELKEMIEHYESKIIF